VLQLQRTLGNQAVNRLMSEHMQRRATDAPHPVQAGIMQRQLAYNQLNIANYDALPDAVKTDLATVQGPAPVKTLVNEMCADPAWNHSYTNSADMVSLLQDVSDRLTTIYAGADPGNEQVRGAHRVTIRHLQRKVGSAMSLTGAGRSPEAKVAGQIPQENMLYTLGAFFEKYGHLPEHIGKDKFNLNSPSARGLGGKYEGGVVHVEAGKQGDPTAFMRLLIHEIGHATFQKKLLQDTRKPLSDTAAKGNANQEIITILNQDGQKFYAAWQVLRAANGSGMHGLGIDSVGDPAQRRAYQAGNFNEFCAETFMHVAMDPAGWAAHVAQQIQMTQDENVRTAWNMVRTVVGKYKDMLLTSATANEPDPLVQYSMVLNQLERGLHGPNLDTTDSPASLKQKIDSIRAIWITLTPNEREQVRSATIGVLDQYVLRIYRRRPAQQWLGQEMGFPQL
jgi:hypothetical protein